MKTTDIDPTAQPEDQGCKARFYSDTVKDETWKDTYSGGVMTAAHADFADERAITAERAQNQAQECKACYEALRGSGNPDMLMILPYILVPRNELKMMLREAKEKAEAAEQRRVQEKVGTWMKQVTSA